MKNNWLTNLLDFGSNKKSFSERNQLNDIYAIRKIILQELENMR
jgi:hypothetical protein